MAHRLTEFEAILLELCQASLAVPEKGPVVPACAQLIQDVASQGREEFAGQHTQTPGPSEYRLNGAGLKLLYEVESYRDGEDTHIYVANLRIGGDQVEEYPAFVWAAERILQPVAGLVSGSDVARRAG
jgi:hypothetical protein